MNVTQALEARRAVKKFDLEFKISDADFKAFMDNVLKSPSSFNIQHWRFVDVQDDEKRAAIRSHAWDQAQVTDASRILLLCADVNAWKKDPAQYWDQSPQGVADVMVPMIGDFYEGREWIQRDEALRSVGIIAQSLMLLASERGYDTCPMIGFDQDEVSKIINLPDDHIIGMMIALGKRGEEPHPFGGRLDYSKVVFNDNF